MIKPIVATKSLRVGKASRPPVNSILAAASTAHDLDTAHRKAAKAKALRGHRSFDGQSRPSISAKQRHETLFQFVLRLGRLVAVQVKERGKR